MGGSAGDRLPVTAVVVTFDSAAHVASTLEALLGDPSGPSEIVVVDSGSRDGTPQVVAGFPVRVIALDENVGYGTAANLGVAAASEEIVAVLNDDVGVAPGWLVPLVEAVSDPSIGAAMPTVELSDRPGTFNTSGGAVTVSGLAWITDLGAPVPDEEAATVAVPFPSGAAFVARREVWDRVGGFRDDFFLYHEDTDLGWRMRLLGLTPVRVPSSKVSHRYEFSRNPDKMELLERNRLRMLVSNYRRSTLLLLAPVLLIHEVGVTWVAFRDGWVGAKARSWRPDLFGRDARRRHRAIQATRVVGDSTILAEMSVGVRAVPIDEVRVPRGAGLVDRVVHAYVRAVLPVVRWIDRRRGLIVR